MGPMESSDKSTMTVTLCYTLEQLKLIQNTMLSSVQNRKQHLDYETIRIVKWLRINRKRIRLQKYQKKDLRRINTRNLINFQQLQEQWSKRNIIHLATVNARSVKNKSEDIVTSMLKKAIDLVVITESWLTDSIHDKVWLQTQQFNDSNLEYYSVPCKSGRKGGGLMLLYNKMIEAEPLPSLQYMSFESQL